MRGMSILLIIIIGWLYVTVLMAVNEPTVVAGVMTFLFNGLLPCVFPAWLIIRKVRRQRLAWRQQLAAQASAVAGDELPGQPDGTDPKTDQ